MYSRFLYGRFFPLKILTLGGRPISFLDKGSIHHHLRPFSSKNDLKPSDFLRKLDLADAHRLTKNDDTDDLTLRTTNSNLHRYSIDRDSDSFFVHPTRLTPGESFYQKLSSGLSVLSVIFLLCFPLSLFIFISNNRKDPSSQPTPIRDHGPNPKLSVLTNSKSLLNLLDSKVPVLIFYYKKDQHLTNPLLLSLNRALLSEISAILSNTLKVVLVDIGAFREPINPSLKTELSKSGGFLYHLLVPYGNDPMITALPPLVSVESFVDEIQKVLGHFKFNLASKSMATSASILSKSIDELDKKLALLRSCLFDLELHNRKVDSLVNEDSLDSILDQCKRVQ
ncbi:conserved hypothetical protein [Theileria orientalis strain Shintoku]|uniref:Uncharacterized protein n=1 Tax=Theileria orientalis strain Shintoku TaxID=869250 RepID=J7M4P0_THEOR|nr:conserved hypothetical protein [Theileria orientalis strain Shintoku]BAM42360.1 conserved hypothetical protein [Theileria orientalis strain Shintoku]|eukprot:XP_009692661.1 conserved hypothetical protein [Theileria orientalis strain Shintoku]